MARICIICLAFSAGHDQVTLHDECNGCDRCALACPQDAACILLKQLVRCTLMNMTIYPMYFAPQR